VFDGRQEQNGQMARVKQTVRVAVIAAVTWIVPAFALLGVVLKGLGRGLAGLAWLPLFFPLFVVMGLCVGLFGWSPGIPLVGLGRRARHWERSVTEGGSPRKGHRNLWGLRHCLHMYCRRSSLTRAAVEQPDQ
jgi:hypothetical protein